MQVTTAVGLDPIVQASWLFWGWQLIVPFGGNVGGNVTPNKVVRSGIKADPLQTICLFCIPQFTGPSGVGNVIPAGPVQDSCLFWYMQVRGPPGVGIVRFDGPVTVQFIRLPGFVQVTLIV